MYNTTSADRVTGHCTVANRGMHRMLNLNNNLIVYHTMRDDTWTVYFRGNDGILRCWDNLTEAKCVEVIKAWCNITYLYK